MAAACATSGELADDEKIDPKGDPVDASSVDTRRDAGSDGGGRDATSRDAGRRDATPGEPTCTDPPCLLTRAQALSVSTGHGCVVTEEHKVACWGWNDLGQLGVGDTTPRSGAIELELEDVREVATGDWHTCILHTNGSVRCWGDNDDGQLGYGDHDARLEPAEPIAGLTDVVQLIAGSYHTCALLGDGSARCWGRNYNGQLGLGYDNEGGVPSPTQVPALTQVKQLTANTAHTCALHEDGSASCWGYGGFGQLGSGSEPAGGMSSSPVRVAGLLGASRIQAGLSTTCAIDADARMTCWGTFNDGHSSTSPTAWAPARVDGVDAEVIDIAPSGYHACALYQSGQAVCWGMNLRGQLGTMECDGAFDPQGIPCDNQTQPTPVLQGGLRSIRSFNFHTCALTEEGSALCWGGNWLGQLGDGTTLDRGAPAPVLRASE